MGMSRSEAGKLGAIVSKLRINFLKQQRIEDYLLTPKFCQNCTKCIPYEIRVNNFCNSSCSAIYNNTHKRIEPRTYTCKLCEKAYRPDQAKQKYCSYDCDVKTRNQRLFENVEIGIASARTCKRYLIEKYGNHCMDCGWNKINQYTGNCPIELEHIDGDSSNNRPTNLKLLCPSCHSLTPTYKALNKGNGRHDRRQRYKDGKSY